MGKFYGKVGYVTEVEKVPGVFDYDVTEIVTTGDIVSSSTSWQNREHLQDDSRINLKISIVSDPYAFKHFHLIRYVEWNGVCWTVTNVEPTMPRLLLTIGGVYNGPKTRTS